MDLPREMASMTDDQAASTPPRDQPAESPGQEPDASPQPDPGYLIETGEAASADGSVAPIIGGLPAVQGSSWDIGASREDRGANLAQSREGGPREPDQEDAPGD
jgi:hypothetical protein